MKIAYFGGDLLGGCLELLISQGHEIVFLFAATPPQGEYDMAKKACKLARKHKAEIRRDKPTTDDIRDIHNAGCDMLISAGYPYKIPEWEGGSLCYGLNIHPSLLPEGAGPMPLPHIILKEYEESGVTLHKLTQNWDRGDILLQERFTVTPKDNMNHLWRETGKIAVNALARFLENPDEYWQNAIPQTPKPEDYWKLPPSGGFQIDYTKGVKTVEKYLRIHNFVHPNGEAEYITDIEFWQELHTHPPGTVIFEQHGQYVIAVNDGFVKFRLVREKL